MNKHKSRRLTPWDGETKLTPPQAFLKRCYQNHYAERHLAIRESDKAEMINFYAPSQCPFC
jgi:hypothetical protein